MRDEDVPQIDAAIVGTGVNRRILQVRASLAQIITIAGQVKIGIGTG
jgi:hypothetical protein